MEVKGEELKLTSRHDGLELGVSVRLPEKLEQAKGIIQLVHGMSEHRQRYHEFMDYCAEQGYVVVIHDHRGHGESVKSENDYGYFYEEGRKGLIDDVWTVNRYIRERFPKLKLILFGHSMGSLVVRCYMQEHDATVDGLIVCGSPSRQMMAGLGVRMVKALEAIKGGHYRSKLMHKTSVGSYEKKFAHEGSPNAWVVSDPEVLKKYEADARDGFMFTLNGFEVLFGLMAQTYRKRGWKMENPAVPVLFIAGEDDPVILSKKDFEKAVQFMRDRGYQNVESKLYPKMRHEILNEIGKQGVWEDIVHWANDNVTSMV